MEHLRRKSLVLTGSRYDHSRKWHPLRSILNRGEVGKEEGGNEGGGRNGGGDREGGREEGKGEGEGMARWKGKGEGGEGGRKGRRKGGRGLKGTRFLVLMFTTNTYVHALTSTIRPSKRLESKTVTVNVLSLKDIAEIRSFAVQTL